jgi:peptide/nickel transport system permease protein
MGRVILRRLIYAVPVALVASIATFALMSFAGSPLSQLESREPPPSAATIAAAKKYLRLNQPLVDQYWHWLTGIFTGNWGPSVEHFDIGEMLWQRLLVTMRLVIVAVLVAMIIAVVVGVISASRRYSVLDHGLSFIGFLMLSMPLFWFAILLQQGAIRLNQALGNRILYTQGEQSIPLPSGFLGGTGDIFAHLLLPTLALSLTTYAAWSRYVRSSTLEVLSADYIRLARAKGLPRRKILVRHALRTALIPFITVVGLDLGTIFSGVVVTETVFQWRGMGDFLVTAIQDYDLYAVMAWLMAVAGIIIAFNLIADLLYAVVDPRIRVG